MDAVDFISQSLAQVQLRLLATCDGLTRQQVLWRPAPHANNIGFVLWHVARVEDRAIARLGGEGRGLWESQAWREKFGHPVGGPESEADIGLWSLPIPALDILIGYLEAVHRQTECFLSSLTAGELDVEPDPSRPQVTTGASLRHLITHKNNHHGQIDYIRGLQDETWDLQPGTGVVLPPPPPSKR